MARILLVGILLAAVFVIAPSAATGQVTEPGDLEWVRTGGPIGGLGYDVRMRPDDPDTMLVTDAFAGMFMSTNGGSNWFPVNDGITTRTGPTGDAIPVFCVTIDPNNPDIVWAGTQNVRGIFRSEDGGHTWSQRDDGVIENDGITFRGIAVDPHDSDVVWAAAEIASWAGDRPGRLGIGFDMVDGVVYKTTNGGASWSAVWRGDNLARYILIDPTDTDTVYVSTGIFDREAANSDPDLGTPGGEGVLRTTDGGTTWRNVNEGLDNLYVGSLFMHPDDPQTLLAATGSNVYTDGTGVYLTTDGAETWAPVLRDPEVLNGFQSIEFAIGDPDVAYAASEARVYRSDDRGVTWTAMTPRDAAWGDPPVRGGFPIDIQVDPRDADRLFINAYGGGNFLSTDAGRTWTVASTGYTGAQIRGIGVDPEHPGRVWVTGRSGLFVSTDGGFTWTGQSPFDPWPTFEGMTLAIAPNGSMLEADNADGGIAYGDGEHWDYAKLGLPYRQAVRALAFAPSDPAVAYAGVGAFSTESFFDDAIPGAGIYRSGDGGRSWRRANDDLVAAAHVSGLAVDPGDPNRVFAATVNQGLVRSEDGGASWQTVSSRDDIAIFTVAVHPTEPGLVFAGARGMFRSTNGGNDWTRVAAGAPESLFVDYTFDPTDPDVLYTADAASGVYRSEDAGQSWIAINRGLRTRAVNALAISSDGNHLYAATEGEGVYRLDLAGSPPAVAPFPTIPTTTVTAAPATSAPATSAVATTTTPLAAPTDDGESTPWLVWAGGGVLLFATAVLGFAGGRRRARRSG